jgi:hypothetical protein
MPAPKRRTLRALRLALLTGYLSGRIHERAATKATESPSDRAARGTARATKWMAIFTLFLVAANALTIWVLVKGGVDSHNLADAAQKTEKSAETSAQASRDFADTASGINRELGTAVGKLNLQADSLAQSVQQTSRLAAATEEANANVLAADRPWFGGDIQVSNFALAETPTATCTFTNSGRRPARAEHVECGSAFYPAFPEKPIYGAPGLHSRMFIAPGGHTSVAWTLFGREVSTPQAQNGQPTAEGMRALDAGELTLFVYGKIEYRDARSGEEHASHVCIRYLPAQDSTPAGFYDCDTYNDGD